MWNIYFTCNIIKIYLEIKLEHTHIINIMCYSLWKNMYNSYILNSIDTIIIMKNYIIKHL